MPSIIKISCFRNGWSVNNYALFCKSSKTWHCSSNTTNSSWWALAHLLPLAVPAPLPSFLSLTLSVSLSLSVSPSLCLYFPLTLNLSMYINMYIHIYECISLSPSFLFSLYLYIYISLSLSRSLSFLWLLLSILRPRKILVLQEVLICEERPLEHARCKPSTKMLPREVPSVPEALPNSIVTRTCYENLFLRGIFRNYGRSLDPKMFEKNVIFI